MRKWFVGVQKKRFRIPGYFRFLCKIPQPHWIKRWYYENSYKWWGHPSNHHWKMRLLWDCKKHNLKSNEKCLWCGAYNSGQNERLK